MIVLALLMQGAEAPPWNCDDPMVQQEMNYCAHQEFKRFDAELNAQWAITSTAIKERDAEGDSFVDDRPGYFETLLTAQRAWLAYRDTHCRIEGYWARGGSLEPLLVSTCMTKLTEQRTQQLQFLIEQ